MPFVVTNITIGIYFYLPKYGNGVGIRGSIAISWYLVKFRTDVIKS
ncbi:uncharacterized protein METZ01_LOCUS252389, partial [marine metagenome]